jgi:hypothetical protein
VPVFRATRLSISGVWFNGKQAGIPEDRLLKSSLGLPEDMPIASAALHIAMTKLFRRASPLALAMGLAAVRLS